MCPCVHVSASPAMVGPAVPSPVPPPLGLAVTLTSFEILLSLPATCSFKKSPAFFFWNFHG